MTRLFTSDLHLGHDNIRGFVGRPHGDIDHMNTDLINRLAAAVTPDDELWLLGDIAMGNIDRTLPLLERIPCPIVIVAGNHDKCHPYRKQHEKWLPRYLDLWNVYDVYDNGTHLTLADGTNVTVNHFPYAGLDARPVIGRDGKVIEDKFAEWRPVDDGGWLLCGHVHSAWRQKGRMINVGVDAWGGLPVSEDEIVTIIAAGPNDLPPQPITLP